MGTKHVSGSTKSTNGCKVDIDGDIIYTLIPLRISGFSGTIHIDGEIGCPNGDLYFETKDMDKVKKIPRISKKKT